MRAVAPEGIANRRWLVAQPGAREFSALGALRVAGVAVAITLAQSAVALLISMAAGNGSPEHAYRAFCRRDGYMYAAIVSSGYKSTLPPTASVNFDESNVAFFPGYPLAGWLVHRAAGGTLSTHASLVLAAQLAAGMFWVYWLLWLRRSNLGPATAAVVTLAAAMHPAAFFLVVAYSESLFLCGLLGFLYWITSESSRARWLAVPHGLLMTFTRLGGLPLTLVPLAAQCCTAMIPLTDAPARLRLHQRRLIQGLSIGLLATLGGLAFFAFCQGRFGAWDLYFQTQREGQGVAADWLWFVRPSSYGFLGATFYPHLDWADDLSRLCVALTVVLLVVIGRQEWRLAARGDQGWRGRLAFYLAAFTLLFVHAAGVSPRHMQSMLRYCYPVHLLLLLALAEWLGGQSLQTISRRAARGLSWGLAALAALQLLLTYRYFQGGWVA